MKIAMMGSGGVGGFFGGRLAHAGYDVSFIARGAHLAAMRERGLTIENQQQGEIRVPKVRATDDPAQIGKVDLVIVSVKLWDTESAAHQIKPLLGPDTGVLSLQNGVIKDDILRRELGDAAVMGGVGYVATTISRPGVIRQTGTMQRIVLGEYDGTKSARATFLYEALVRAGVNAELSDDVRRAIWEKYVFLVALSATTTWAREPSIASTCARRIRRLRRPGGLRGSPRNTSRMRTERSPSCSGGSHVTRNGARRTSPTRPRRSTRVLICVAALSARGCGITIASAEGSVSATHCRRIPSSITSSTSSR